MKPPIEAFWTLDELCSLVSQSLAGDYAGAPNGRVREVPDQRTIRYYTMLGLIDRPAAFRGRTALYGRRHLMQLVAIKRMQARGESLKDVQQKLFGRPDVELETLARLPAHLERPATPATQETSETPDRPSESFWKASPNPIVTETAPSPYPLQGLPLTEEVVLLLPTARSATPEDLQALRSAAVPLLKLLEQRRLLRPR
jgi:DNA-binding transcriptional MerR regulator